MSHTDHGCNKCQEGTQNTEITQSDTLPIYDKPELPQDGELILLVTGADNTCGGELTRAYRMPLDRLTPGSTLQPNTYSAYAPNNTITVAPKTVSAGFTDMNFPHEIKLARADSVATLAKYIILGEDVNVDDRLMIQSGGFYSFPTTHDYTIGKQYYLSATNAGQVVTAEPTTPNVSQPLFYVVDAKTILVNL